MRNLKERVVRHVGDTSVISIATNTSLLQ